MKKILSNLFALMIVASTFTACNKVEDLKINGDGTAPTLSSSTLTFAAQAADSSNTLVSFNWTYQIGRAHV